MSLPAAMPNLLPTTPIGVPRVVQNNVHKSEKPGGPGRSMPFKLGSGEGAPAADLAGAEGGAAAGGAGGAVAELAPLAIGAP